MPKANKKKSKKKYDHAGHPTSYNKKYIKKVDEYLKQCKDEYLKIIKQFNDDKGYEMYDNKLTVNLPSIEGYSMFIDKAISTIYSWRDKNKEFLEALEKIKRAQKKQLIDNGLAGNYNSTICKLILSSNHSMVERSEVEHRGLSDLLDEIDEEDRLNIK